ncbi:scaffolding protein [Microbacterium phage Jemerald]|nr:scaffolding protein [Microbacterium phage Juicer]WNO27246.1 scaffolding protein [Microbacterium phage Jemerald]
MAPETQEQQNGSTDETPGQEQQDQQQQTPPGETPGSEEQQPVKIDDSTKLPETHPLVKTLASNKTQIGDLKRELAEARTASGKATQLQEELDKRPTQETLDTLQSRYDRLEAFAQAVGLGRALDSRTFTRDLFESDKDIEQLVKDWHKEHPTATSTALGAGTSAPADGKQDPNKLIRAAWNGGK